MKGWEDVSEEDILKLSYRKNIKPAINRKIKTGKTKYNAVKTEIDGIKFDSKAEANYYSELLIKKKLAL